MSFFAEKRRVERGENKSQKRSDVIPSPIVRPRLEADNGAAERKKKRKNAADKKEAHAR